MILLKKLERSLKLHLTPRVNNSKQFYIHENNNSIFFNTCIIRMQQH